MQLVTYTVPLLRQAAGGSWNVITQNIDGLHLEAFDESAVAAQHLAEVHGRMGLFKCIVRWLPSPTYPPTLPHLLGGGRNLTWRWQRLCVFKA